MNTEGNLTLSYGRDRLLTRTFSTILLAVLLLPAMVSAQQKQSKPSVSKEQQQKLDLMKSRGIRSSITILPVRLMGEPFDRVSEVVGVLLEQQGLVKIELSKTAFTHTGGTDLPKLPVEVGEFAKKQGIRTDYVLYAEMNGDKDNQRIAELVGIVVDKTGAVVWTDRLGPGDEEFKKVEDPDPMGFSVLLVQRLGPQMGLNEETAKNAKPGKMAAIMNERSGVPPESETSPMPQRQQVFRDNISHSSLIVFPLRLQGKTDKEGAGALARMISDSRICQTGLAANELLLKSSQEGPNEMKKLWDLARDFRDYLKKNPVNADYAMYADYALPGYVHFVVCDRKGDWVIADLQNSTRPDFIAFQPNTVENANKLVVVRLSHYSKTSVSDVIRQTIQKSGIEAAVAKFREMRANMAGKYLSEEEMNTLGYEFLQAKKISEAIAVFKMNVEAFPDSWNTYDSLGEAYAAAGQNDLAIQNYEKSLQLNPNSPSGNEALKKLKAKQE